jgi:uncharacterized protein (DUF2336 family)
MLTKSDVQRLLEENSASARTETAEKISDEFKAGKLTEAEREIAEDIIRTLAQDVELNVRAALSNTLKDSRALPHDVAMTLARDVEQVALPLLEVSEVFTDDDLVELIRSEGSAKQTAVARRRMISPKVTDALADEGSETAVAELVRNDGAQFSEPAMQKILDRFTDSDNVKGGMGHRVELPPAIAERLATIVSEALRDRLVTHHKISDDLATDLVLEARERITAGLIADRAREMNLESLVRQLSRNGRLTPSMVLRILFLGDIGFLEASLAEMARIPLTNAQKLVHDQGKLGLEAVLVAAKMPPALSPAIRVAIDVIKETDYDEGENDRERYRRRVLERILTQYEDIDADDLEYVLKKLVAPSPEGAPAQMAS